MPTGARSRSTAVQLAETEHRVAGLCEPAEELLRHSARPDRLLAIYLNDHLAGSALGVEFARRLRASNASDPSWAQPLADVCAEIEADRVALQQVMARLDIRRGFVKPAAAWAAEKVGRLKLNGQIRGYSPLSRLVELEALYLGITGKMRMWRALEHSIGARAGEFELPMLADRAARQRSTVEELHFRAAALAFPSSTSDDDRAG